MKEETSMNSWERAWHPVCLYLELGEQKMGNLSNRKHIGFVEKSWSKGVLLKGAASPVENAMWPIWCYSHGCGQYRGDGSAALQNKLQPKVKWTELLRFRASPEDVGILRSLLNWRMPRVRIGSKQNRGPLLLGLWQQTGVQWMASKDLHTTGGQPGEKITWQMSLIRWKEMKEQAW